MDSDIEYSDSEAPWLSENSDLDNENEDDVEDEDMEEVGDEDNEEIGEEEESDEEVDEDIVGDEEIDNEEDDEEIGDGDEDNIDEEVDEEIGEDDIIEEESIEDDEPFVFDEEKVVKNPLKKEFNITKSDLNTIEEQHKFNSYNKDQYKPIITNVLRKFTSSEKNINILEKNIVDNITVKNLPEFLLYLYYLAEQKINIKQIQQVIKTKSFQYSDIIWDEYNDEMKKEVNKLKTPIEVVEGIFVCKKCGQNKTQNYSVQLRRADEPPTVFVHCMNKDCRNKWREG